MTKTWFCSDHHFGHLGMVRFTDNEGKKLRPFETIEEHDEMIIKWHNELVQPEDRVYIMGDLAMSRKHISKVGRLLGRKKFIKGNHDIFKLPDYLPYFDDIISYKIYPDDGIVVSHMPVHPNQLERRWKANVHGHTHSNLVTQIGSKVPDQRYISMCLEKINFRPVEFHDLLKKVRAL